MRATVKKKSSRSASRSKSRERKTMIVTTTTHLPDELKEDIEKFALADFAQQYFRQQRTLFNKKIRMEKILEFTKTPIKESILLSCDELNKEAIDMFKGILEFMGDRKSSSFFGKEASDLEIAHLLLKLAIDNPQIRDELYVQLVKQTTANPYEKSEEKGWELMCMALEVFLLPSPNFENHLRHHFHFVADKSTSPRIKQFATYCSERLANLALKPRAPQLPNPSLLSQAREAPFIKSVFRSSLEQMMEYQKTTHPDLMVPIVLQTLIQLIIDHGGLETVGIFRVAAQVDELAELKKNLEISKGETVPGVNDPNVPACLLKLWLSEIRFPLIPTEFYTVMTQNCKDWATLERILTSFPILYSTTLVYLVNFLQKVIQSENKMTAANVAIVISPTLCRCPVTDTFLVMQQTMLESELCVTLLKNMPPIFPF
uniref:Rho-GAP domain-containing protein n=1 Tax=Arcella intermedia TaxID=1963864 RepID=A0A6B2L1N0_9EUKA